MFKKSTLKMWSFCQSEPSLSTGASWVLPRSPIRCLDVSYTLCIWPCLAIWPLFPYDNTECEPVVQKQRVYSFSHPEKKKTHDKRRKNNMLYWLKFVKKINWQGALCIDWVLLQLILCLPWILQKTIQCSKWRCSCRQFQSFGSTRIS